MRPRWKRGRHRHRKRRHDHRNASASVPTAALYEPLPSQSSIRLITLHPGDFNDPIRCTLEVFELASIPPYEAISYVWGDPTPRNRIRCNGRPYLIGNNVNDVIRNVRLKDEIRVIWIDALCINQANLGERSHQVLLMRDIYSKAKRTLICLDIKPSVNTRDVCWTNIAYQAILIIAKWSKRNSFPPELSGSKHGIEKFAPLELKHWVALRRLFSCAWFHRVWVIQEVVLSPDSIFIVDRQEWRWYPLAVACIRIVENSKAMDEIDSIAAAIGITHVFQLWFLMTRGEKKVVPLFFLKWIFKYALATDPRDLMYALLGISKELPLVEQQIRNGLSGPVPLPNYEDSFRDVFIDWTRYFIESSRGLEIFSMTLVKGEGSPDSVEFYLHKGHGESDWTAEDASFPSWVPRWHIASRGNLYDSRNLPNGKYLGYRTSGNLPLKLKTSARRESITPSGVMFDTVSWTGKVMYPISFYPKTQDDALMYNFLGIESKLKSYPNGDTVQNAYAIVAAAGHLQEKPTKNRSSPGEDMMIYIAWLTLASKVTSNTTRRLDNAKDNTGWDDEYVNFVEGRCLYRRFFITEKGYIGLGPFPMEVGDLVCVLFGGKTPFILRNVEDHFKLIGEAYIHGIMDGEVVRQWEAGELGEQWFEIR